MIKDSLYFMYAGENSSDYGLLNVNIDSGMQEENIGGQRTILEESTRGRTKPYYQGIQHSPIQFTLTCAFQDRFNDDLINKICRWLCRQTYYKPMMFSENPEKIYYVLAIDDVTLVHNCLSQGYLKITFRANDYYAYSPIYQNNYSLNPNTTGTIITINNLGNEIIYPVYQITKIGAGNIDIYNISNANQHFQITNLIDNEELTIYNEEQIIETSLANTYRYDNHNNIWTSLVYGVNNLKITGACELLVKYQYKFN